ncbi:MAG: PD40 domain-containing protein, partial [Thermomicrobiales bacterium]|nr:PD40 domain-containing protein [Thermomicrobiales bacterium]
MTRRPIQIDDLYRIRLVADPNISPDGQKVAWVVTTVDKESNGYTSNIWCADLAGDNTPYRLTTAKGKDTSPRWSPDGS